MCPQKHLIVFALLSAFALVGVAACQPEAARPVSSAAATPATDSPPPAASNITVAAVGDIMLGSTYPASRGLPPEDGATMLRQVTPLLTPADIAFGNLEGPMLEGGTTSKCGPNSHSCFAFRV